MTILGLLLAGAVLGGTFVFLLVVWSCCVVASQADDALDRYFREQKAKAQLYGCAIPAQAGTMTTKGNPCEGL